MRRADLQTAAARKLDAAVALFDAKKYSNAYYLAGYTIEFSLKACIAKQISSDTIPPRHFLQKIYTHDFTTLVGLAGLTSALKTQSNSDSTFAANWAMCNEWSPDARYIDKIAPEASYLLGAISDPKHGVFPWIQKYW